LCETIVGAHLHSDDDSDQRHTIQSVLRTMDTDLGVFPAVLFRKDSKRTLLFICPYMRVRIYCTSKSKRKEQYIRYLRISNIQPLLDRLAVLWTSLVMCCNRIGRRILPTSPDPTSTPKCRDPPIFCRLVDFLCQQKHDFRPQMQR